MRQSETKPHRKMIIDIAPIRKGRGWVELDGEGNIGDNMRWSVAELTNGLTDVEEMSLDGPDVMYGNSTIVLVDGDPEPDEREEFGFVPSDNVKTPLVAIGE
jgi:hypothetical protein